MILAKGTYHAAKRISKMKGVDAMCYVVHGIRSELVNAFCMFTTKRALQLESC